MQPARCVHSQFIHKRCIIKSKAACFACTWCSCTMHAERIHYENTKMRPRLSRLNIFNYPNEQYRRNTCGSMTCNGCANLILAQQNICIVYLHIMLCLLAVYYCGKRRFILYLCTDMVRHIQNKYRKRM